MSKDMKRLYITSISVLVVLLSVLFVEVVSSKILTAILLVPISVIVSLVIRKRSTVSINKKEALLLMIVLATIYGVLTQMSGAFLGYVKNPYFVNLQVFLRLILPTAAIIVSSEIIRYVFLSQKSKFVSVIAFVICLIAEILTFSSLPGITSFNKFMDLVGLTLFPAVSANFFYHYSSKKFGMFPNIAFRLITTLYIYFVPRMAAMKDALSSCIKIIIPIVLYMFMAALYEKKQKPAVQRGKKITWVATLAAGCVVVLVAMLISCQFRFGAIVIATESMTGEINKGDMIVYERYDDQNIKVGQVIVFMRDGSRIVHRVVEIDHRESGTRYYTKGDANEGLDVGFVIDEEIVGLTDVKVAYIGYPTLWLRELLRGSN